ncbi:unnamed protein product [Trichobilharzia regenti]|nr:unnamed protein product [Trichobilharzia regenti]
MSRLSINSFLHNGLRRHFIIDRAQTAIPDSSECRVKQNFIQTKDQSCDWENLPYDQSGRATVPVIIYHDECQYFNEISNHQNDTNNIVNNNNNNSDNNEKGMTKNFRLQKVKYQRNNSNPTEVQSAVHSSDQQQQQSQQYHQRQAEQRRHYEPENISINSHNNSYRNAEKTNSKIIFFQREGKQIYYRSPLPRRTPVNKFPRRANLNHHLINPNNNNEKINQSDDYQEHKINTRGLINQEKDSLGQNQPIILYESRKPCQQDQMKHVNLDRSDRNDNTYRRKSEICITRMDNFSEIKLLEKNEATSSRNSQYKNHSGDNDKQIKYNKRPLLSYISVYKEEGQQTDILDIENTNSVKREMPIRKPFVKPQDLRSYVHYYDSDNNITGKLRIVKHQQQQQQNGNNEIPQQNHSSLTTTSTTNSNNNISNCSTLQDNVPIKPGRINWAYGITVQNANLNILLTTLNKVVDRNCLDYVRINPYCILCTHVKYNHHHQNNQNNNNNNFISVNHDDNQSTKSSSSQLHTLKHCTNDNETVSILKWEIEIVQLPRLQTYGIRFKLIDGDLIQYRIMEKSLTAQCVQIMNSLIT